MPINKRQTIVGFTHETPFTENAIEAKTNTTAVSFQFVEML